MEGASIVWIPIMQIMTFQIILAKINVQPCTYTRSL